MHWEIVEIKPAIIDGKILYPLQPLKKLFAKKQYTDIAEWYTVAEIIEKFGSELLVNFSGLAGARPTRLVFKGFKKTMLQTVLPKQLQAAGITKHITFHCLRHVYFSFSLKTSELKADFS